MKHLKVALSDSVQSKIGSLEGRICVPVCDTDFIDVGAVVIGDCDLELINNNREQSPLFFIFKLGETNTTAANTA